MNVIQTDLSHEAPANVPAQAAQPSAPAQQAEARAGEAADTGTGNKDQERTDPSQVVSKAQEYFKQQGVDLHFKVLDDSGQVQVEMVTEDNRKVIRKIPGDELVKLSDNLKRMAKGVLDVAV